MVRAVGEPQSHHNLGSVLKHLVVPLGLDSNCFLLRLRFLRALDDRVFLNVPYLRLSPCFQQLHIGSFRFYERISQRDSRFLRFGWFTSTSCAHTVFIAGIDNQPIRFSIAIWALLETGPGEMRFEQSE